MRKKVTVCDRCGAIIEGHSTVHLRWKDGTKIREKHDVDLCEDCWSELVALASEKLPDAEGP